jgi:hypothetical protein
MVRCAARPKAMRLPRESVRVREEPGIAADHDPRAIVRSVSIARTERLSMSERARRLGLSREAV